MDDLFRGCLPLRFLTPAVHSTSMEEMKMSGLVLVLLLAGAVPQPVPKPAQTSASVPIAWPSNLPVYDHIVIVIEENKDYRQIINDPAAPCINGTLRTQGASFTRMYAEEHHSLGRSEHK